MRAMSSLARDVAQRREHAARLLERHLEIVPDGVALEHGGLLEFAADAEIGDRRLVELGQVDCAVEEHLAVVGPRLAGDDVHHRRLAGAVGADDRQHLAGMDDDREIVERLEAVEADTLTPSR